MFIDASVIVAVLGREPGWEEVVKRLDGETGAVFVSPLVRFEAVLGLARRKATAGGGERKPSPDMVAQARAAVDEFIAGIGAEEVEISAAIGALAIEASMS
jgi:ribonuclease VapC